jgi:hypothetical protein
MKTLQKPNEQLAGNLELFITPVANLHSIASQAITVTDEDLILKIICLRETLHHVVTATKTKAGRKYTHKINALTYGQSVENDALLNQFMIYKLYVIVRQSTGEYAGIGAINTGLGLEWEYDSGTDASGSKGYALSITGELLLNTMPLTAVYNLAGLPVSEVIAPAEPID